MEKLSGYVLWHYCLPFTASTVHAIKIYWQWSLSLYIALSEIIEFSLFTTIVTTLFNERRSNSLIVTKVVRAAYWFDHRGAMRIKTINTEAVIFLLSACCIEALDFPIWSCSLKVGHEFIFKATGLVLSMFEPTCLSIAIRTRKKTSWNGLTHEVGELLASINFQ